MKVEPNNFCPAGRSPPIIGSFRSLPHTQTFSLPFKLLLDHVKVDNNPRHHPTFHRHSVGLSSSQSSSPSSKNVLCGLKQVYHLLRHHQQQHWNVTSITLLSLSVKYQCFDFMCKPRLLLVLVSYLHWLQVWKIPSWTASMWIFIFAFCVAL